MSYRIQYAFGSKIKGILFIKIRLPILLLCCLILFNFLVRSFWPEGTAVLESTQTWIQSLPVISALNQLATDFQKGEDFLAAFSGFFETVRS